jgi:AcrR family transcriptional regulator
MDTYHHGNLKRALTEHATNRLKDGKPDELSLRGIAREVGVSPTAVYHHFPSKDDLLAAVAEKAFSDLLTEWATIDVTDIGLSYVRYFRSNPALLSLLFGPRLRAFPNIAALQDQSFETLRKALGTQSTDPTIALFLWSLIHGLTTLYNAKIIGTDNPCGPGQAPWNWEPEEVIRRFLPLIEAAIATASMPDTNETES